MPDKHLAASIGKENETGFPFMSRLKSDKSSLLRKFVKVDFFPSQLAKVVCGVRRSRKHQDRSRDPTQAHAH